jgi:hypothetical protein
VLPAILRFLVFAKSPLSPGSLVSIIDDFSDSFNPTVQVPLGFPSPHTSNSASITLINLGITLCSTLRTLVTC